MASGEVCVINSEIDELQQVIERFGTIGTKTVNDVLHKEAPQIIVEHIHPLLPISHRSWKKKKTAASSTQPFRSDTEELLSVTVRSKKIYNYLYFPDDGSNTEHHQGNQHFMKKGASRAIGKIAELCTEKLINDFNKGG